VLSEVLLYYRLTIIKLLIFVAESVANTIYAAADQ